MGTYVLVHGAWHGAWCWARVVERLEARGHKVNVPTLTGMGELAHLLAPTNDLETHIDDVLAVLEGADLHDVALCAHSYGGMVARGVCDRARERLGAVLYLDAYLPEHGQCGLDLRTPEANQSLLEVVEREGHGWKVPAPPAERFGLTDPDDVALVESLLTPMALRCFQQPISLEHTFEVGPPASYVRTRWPNASLDEVLRRFMAAGLPWERWECGHDAMLESPEDVVRVLESLR